MSDDDIIIKILKPVNSLPGLNKRNVIEKIRDESHTQYKAGNHIYYEISRALKGVDHDFNFDDSLHSPGRTLLHYAAKGGCEKIAGALIAKGADVSRKDRWGCTPLDLAIESGNEELVKLIKEAEEVLTKKRANYLSKNSCSKTPKSPGTNGDITKFSEEAKEMQLKTNKAIAIGAISGSLTALASAIIAAALFATGVMAVEALTILTAITLIATAGLAVGGVTYLILKPNTEINEAQTDQQKAGLKV